MKELKDIIRSDLQNRYDIRSPVFKTLSVASLLDPRFKQRHLENKEEIVTRIIDECIGSFVSSEIVQGELPPPAKKLKGLAAVLTHMIDTETTSGTSTVLSPSEKINLDISPYLDLKIHVFQIWLYSPESIYGFVELVFHLKGCLAYQVTFATAVVIVCYQKMSIN